MTTRSEMTPTEVVTEVLRALAEQRWSDVAQFVDPLQLQELLDREVESVRRESARQPGSPVRLRFGVDSLSELEGMSPSERFANLLRSQDENVQLRFHLEVAEPRALEFMPVLPRTKYSVVGEVTYDAAAFVLYSSGGSGPASAPEVVTLTRSASGWSVVPRGELFLRNDMFFEIARDSDFGRPSPLAVEQMPWTARRFDHRLPIELFPSVLERFRGTPERTTEIIGITPQRALTAKPAGKWSVQEHLGHLLDLEELGERRLADFRTRAQQLTAADMSNRRTEEAKHNEASIWTLQQHFAAAREKLVAKLAALPANVIAQVALHPRLQRPMNVVEWVYFMCEHDDHHLARMRAQSIELSGEIWDRVFGGTGSRPPLT